MKKIFSFIFTILVTMSANAQLVTNSNYDVNADGNVTVKDATAVVSNYVGDKSGERQVVDAGELNEVLKSIYAEIKSLKASNERLERELGIMTNKGHEYVDLGLSVKWASVNIGATSPEDCGDYFAWGETEPQSSSSYSWDSYKWYASNDKLAKYCNSSQYGELDNKEVLDLDDDAAHVNWGGSWRMPTEDELNELFTECTWEWTTVNSVNGFKVKSNKNSNSIFIPAAGYYKDGSLDLNQLYGYIWSNSLNRFDPYSAKVIYFSLTYSEVVEQSRSCGYNVRAVCP